MRRSADARGPAALAGPRGEESTTMLRYTLNRVLLMIPTLLGVAVLVFFMLRIVPGRRRRGEAARRRRRRDAGNHRDGAQAARARQAADRTSSRTGWSASRRSTSASRCGPSGRSSRRSRSGSSSRCRSRSWRRIIAVLLAIPLGNDGGAVSRHLGRLCWCASSRSADCRFPSFWFGMLIMLAPAVAVQLAAADHVHADLRRPGRQPDAADLARARGRLPLLRGGRAHDPLLAARSAQRGLHPHRARQGRVREAGDLAPRAAQRAAAGYHRDRHSNSRS